MKRFPLKKILKSKQEGRKIVSITAYDLFTAQMAQEADVDIVLTGDSLGNVVQGNDTTIPVSLDEMIYHAKIVSKHAPDPLVIIDMPFGSYGISKEKTVHNCSIALKQSGAGAVKMEGCSDILTDSIKSLVDIGVPVMGHLGFTPQSVNVFGGFKIDGKTANQVEKLFHDAKKLEEAGAFSIVLECVKEDVAQKLSQELSIPTIGIGSGAGCDGQIIVVHDLLGMSKGKLPSFVRKYASLYDDALAGITKWRDDVVNGDYPGENECYK